ncbi:hypothetical protein HPB50_004852 [Hyalomma asiaticum]|uniref:Uncharacterized protein n=1 Tax=Hyalomma asiaticum TaxID=266040 RepID=A0ACB7SEY0_HYAAI|nr:hypothetical protein HPB50_004852 [Hyalomma asiaticum]
MANTMTRDDGSGTSRRPKPSSSFTEPEGIDVSPWTPSWTTCLGTFLGIGLVILLSALVDVAVKMGRPGWEWWFFTSALYLAPIGAIVYKMNEFVAAIRTMI